MPPSVSTQYKYDHRQELGMDPDCDCTVDRIDRYPVEIPFREVPGRNLRRELPHWKYFEIFEIELGCGAIGYGETMLYYTDGETDQAAIDRALGANAVELLYADSLGPGIQIALFDAVGRALDVPAHRLLGSKTHDRTPLSWWCIDMPPEDWVQEAERALDAGYTSLKVKGRPWFDIREQIEALEGVVPEWFDVDIDFNGTLLDAESGLSLLQDLEESPLVSHFETPIPQEDVDGNHRLQRELSTPIVFHYGRREPLTAIRANICDGLLVNGGAEQLRNKGAVAAMADLPVWIQLVGTGVTTAFSLHCGGVLDQAIWPAVNCHQIYTHSLLADPIDVEEGFADVPDGPGLGHEIDMDAVRRFEIEKLDERPSPPRLIETEWPDGRRLYVAPDEVNALLNYAQEPGTMPYFERGVETRLIEDDERDEWQQFYEQARDGPVRVAANESAPSVGDVQ